MNENIKELMDTVVRNDYCIGCGVCASLQGSPLSMKLNEDGKYIPFLGGKSEKEEIDVDVLAVCPFSNKSKKETEIGNELFNQENNATFNQFTGFFIKNYAGYVTEGNYRKNGSSGGMGSWITAQLLKLDLVDAIIHVKSSNEEKNILFEYQISYNEEELLKGTKSRYYPVEMSHVLEFVKSNPGRYAIVGIPCFIKSIRLLADQDTAIKESIKFCIALVCGHLKSDMFAKSIGWELGIEPEQLKEIDFRKKLEDRYASDYGVEVVGLKEGNTVVASKPTKELYTTNWGHGLFKYNACEFCDDILGETADITVGDAWLPEYVKESLGTNIIVVRNPLLQKIIENNLDKVHLDEISTEKIYQSQASGIRHRREGLAYRLYLKDKKGEWRPNKRTNPSKNISSKRKQVYEKRELLYKESFIAYKTALKNQDFKAFVNYMNPIISEYDKIVSPSKVRMGLSKVKREMLRLIRK
ncbi:coenzyme F420 hydrogenase [Pradoshia sp. D12]|uniref:Coenzyme F420 hydrogenase/dehydrogenase, beta subunit C-terminal domain n=1 Tax=Bacillaceae TaxID=186817 RepID=UPI001129FA45|nr:MULTISPECIES: Coenzyme F420 hydrogenase/dehydrogenase, beta subunit C-terminal domain [Bacillaceae]QFK72920.1 coenzyme F420 hydrogenase [Pradoshia sp. D12]TPF71912.1 coenzyme F420 hydrogenase [Bacillus sp. D12]